MDRLVKETIALLHWHEKGVFNKKHLCVADPTPQFWDIWTAHKDRLKRNGVTVTKRTGEYQVCLWSDVHERAIEPVLRTKTGKLLNNCGLLTFQRSHVFLLVRALQSNGTALDGSDTGTGKTPCAAAAVRELRAPFFVLCPKTIIPDWFYWCRHIGVEPIDVINYEALKTNKHYSMTIKTTTGKDGKKNRTVKWNLPPETIMVFDEASCCKGRGTINSLMLAAAKRQGYRILLLSATLADNPMQMQATGFALNLFPKYGDFYRWIEAYGCYRNGWTKNGYSCDREDLMKSGFSFTSNPFERQEVIGKLHQAIYGSGRGARMRIAELGDKFPNNQVIATAYKTDNAKKIQRIYSDLGKEIRRLKYLKGKTSNRLTIELRARQEVELLKAPIFVELAKYAIEEGNSVAIFVNFQKSIDFICQQLKTGCKVHGEQTGKERQRNIRRFQANEERVIVCNSKAGGIGVSLHDLDGGFPRLSLISPSYSAQDIKQDLGRIHRAGAKSPARQRIIFAADTIEERVCEKMKEKINRISRLNDGDMALEFLEDAE